MRDDRDDPFGDIFDEIERMMNGMAGPDAAPGDAGFGSETHVSTYESDEEVRVVADLPGVDEDSIDLKCDGEVLTLAADGPNRQYEERVRLPSRVDEHSAEASFNNGVLQVTFEAVDDSASIDL
ncbi:Hsp20/alpha crystallin family protein [Halobaculum sp. MBLA0147]|uniref:Hsp20/alpha crystallin family protein n=1 Tax=Halobaculum sp. MBLA0147 TaxID=3079934 RepID=UPI0035269A8B